jgi:hypothetical protein
MRDTDAADELTAGLNSLQIAQYRGISQNEQPPAEPPKTFASLDADAVELIVRLLPGLGLGQGDAACRRRGCLG